MKRWMLIGILLTSLLGSLAYALTYAIENSVVNVDTTADKLPTSPLVGRKYILLKNIGAVTLYVGKSDVTADTTGATGGFQLLPQEKWYAEYDHTVEVYGIVASSTCNVAVEEGK